MKIYIAGSITGNPHHKEEFARAEDALTRDGNIAINPAVLPAGFKHAEYMSVCIPMLSICDAIYLLRGWEASIGANAERAHAKQVGKLIMYEE